MAGTHKPYRTIRRTLLIDPRFHETDMLGMIHNAVYFQWFELGRLEILKEILSFEESMRLGAALPVIRNSCSYKSPARYGERLVLQTEHELVEPYAGSLVFRHTLTNQKTKAEVASGESAVTIVDAATGKLVREWPPEIRQRYLALAQ
jgi:acyl-CoA thioester hydrolase